MFRRSVRGNVNYPRLKPGACSGGPLWGTGLQFNLPEDCFIQPYSCRPVDTASTDYPWNHGITGYFPSHRRHTSHASCRWLESPLQESASVHQYLMYRPQNTKTLRIGQFLPRIKTRGLQTATRDKIVNQEARNCSSVMGYKKRQNAKVEDLTILTGIAWRTQLYAGTGRRHSSPG